MTTTLAAAHVPLLTLAATNHPERPADPLPVEDHGFRLLIAEAHPHLDYAAQQRCGTGETIHIWRHRLSGAFVVLTVRANGQHGVKEAGGPWYDRLSRLAGMWEATSAPGGDVR
jgi:hypothetical protein